MTRISTDIINNAYDKHVDLRDLLQKAESDLLTIGLEISDSNTPDLRTLIEKVLGETAVPTGFSALDRFYGFRKSSLTVVAARPAMGKTTFALSIAKNLVEQNIPVAYFSLEFSDAELGKRLVASELGWDLVLKRLQNKTLSDNEWKQIIAFEKSGYNFPLYIDDSASLNMFELRAKCRRLKQKHDIQMVIVDYLQLIQGSAETRGNRERETAEIMLKLKALAKELRVPIVVLSQIHHDEVDENKRPEFSKFKLKAIEQNADMLMFIHRPEYYGITEDEDGNSTAGMAELIVAKNRLGPTGTALLKFNKEFVRVEDLT